ncbi:MAG TPA: DUF4130 domain-containing protein, partial [Clostridiales bacterium]|nr:DUF4130 domain-containing protein [Clostridiales bacterium]
FYDKSKWFISNIDIKKDLIFHEKEMFYQELWKRYFESITIKNRLNPKLQANFMPKRYWKYLVEMK